jgi:hypothetical protein
MARKASGSRRVHAAAQQAGEALACAIAAAAVRFGTLPADAPTARHEARAASSTASADRRARQ